MSLCRDCHTFDPKPNEPRPVPGFGRCALMAAEPWRWVSPHFPCHFNPPRWSAA